MTEQEIVDQDQPMVEEIEFQGRTLKIRAPKPEQVLIWQRTMKHLEAANLSDWTGEQVLAALERARMIIDSLLYDPADISWLDDEMLAGRVDLKEASGIIIEAMKRMTGQGNRAQRRAAAKKAPARRKAPEKAAAPAKKTKE